MELWAFIIGSMIAAAGYGVGYWHYGRLRPQYDNIREYLDSQLNVEDIDRAERRLRAQLHAAKRSSVPNPRAGQPVRISSISVKGRT